MVSCLGSLVQSCCGEGGTLQTNITGVCGEYSQCLSHIGFSPAHSVCAFLVYTAQAPGCSVGELPEVGPGLCALPRSKPLRFRFLGILQGHRLGWAHFAPFPGLSRSGDQVLGNCTVPDWLCVYWSWLFSLLVRHKSTVSGVPCVSSGELISGCDPPGRYQPSRIPGRHC